MQLQITTIDDNQVQEEKPNSLDGFNLPCEGIHKVSKHEENIDFSYCKSAYWTCPNKNCIMNLV